MRFLLAWEQGGRLGHLAILLPIAREIRGRGHEVLFAVKNVGAASFLLDCEGFNYLQAPLPAGLAGARCEAVSFADVLFQAGFGDVQILGGMVRGWQTVFALHKPDAVLSQYAPVATLTAGLLGIPCMNLSTGFESPPEISPYPCFRPWRKITPETLLETENRLLDNVNQVRRDFGGSSLSYLHQAIRADVSLLAILPEMDQYPGRKNGRYIGPLFLIDEGEVVHWSGQREQRIFVYLVPGVETPLVLEVLDRCGAEVIAFVPGIAANLREQYSGTGVRICSEKINLSGLLSGMTLAINNANLGTLSATLLSGVPSLCIPTHIEQLMNSYSMERIGAGIGLKLGRVTTHFDEVLAAMLVNCGYRNNAVNISIKYAGYDQKQVVGNLANTLEKMTSYTSCIAGCPTGTHLKPG